jgi:addiction module RelB/DinJ family antitoxin
MTLVTRTAMIQARVVPDVKVAGEHVLKRIGLTVSEAMELFIRRMIVDQRLPFDVIALTEEHFADVVQDVVAKEEASRLKTIEAGQGKTKGKYGKRSTLRV